MKLPDHVSESVKKLNPHLYPVVGLPHTEREQVGRRESKGQELDCLQTGVGVRVTIISFRRRRVDEHDNLRYGAKPLVDRITETLGFGSDDDERLSWEFAQVITGGVEGTIVKIDLQ